MIGYPELFLIFMLLVMPLVVVVWMSAKILKKAGLSGWWSLTQIIPILGIVMLWAFAYAEWPGIEHDQSLPIEEF